MTLRDLIEAVEAGTLCRGEFISQADGDMIDACFPLLDDDVGAWEYVALAMDGSLDAAKALHDALLPGWVVRLTAGTDQASFPYVHVFKPRQTEDDPPMGSNSSGYRGYDPARAWLLAILRAMEAEGR